MKSQYQQMLSEMRLYVAKYIQDFEMIVNRTIDINDVQGRCQRGAYAKRPWLGITTQCCSRLRTSVELFDVINSKTRDERKRSRFLCTEIANQVEGDC